MPVAVDLPDLPDCGGAWALLGDAHAQLGEREPAARARAFALWLRPVAQRPRHKLAGAVAVAIGGRDGAAGADGAAAEPYFPPPPEIAAGAGGEEQPLPVGGGEPLNRPAERAAWRALQQRECEAPP